MAELQVMDDPTPETGLNVSCPNCQHRFAVSAVASVPDEQKLVVTLEHESPWIAAETLSGTIENTAKLLIAIAENVGTKVTVMASGCKLEPNKTTIELMVVAIKPETK